MNHAYKSIVFTLIFCMSLFHAQAQKVEVWASYNNESILPYKSFQVVGFNVSSVKNDHIIQWIQEELKRNHNQIDSILIFNPESSNLYQYKYWVEPVRQGSSEAILVYNITSTFTKSKKKIIYKPVLSDPYKSNFGSYFMHQSKMYHSQKHENYVIELNIFDGTTLNIIWSGRSKPLNENQLKTHSRKNIDKLLRKAIRQEIINTDSE